MESGMQFGLPQKNVESIRKVLSRFPQVEQAVLYGSRAKGTHKAGSDIDITLIGNAITSQIIFNILNEIELLNMPYDVDISAFKEVKHEALREHIKRVGKVFYQKGNSSEYR